MAPRVSGGAKSAGRTGDFSRGAWTEGGAFADASGVSVFGNTLFIETDDGTVARPLGACTGNGYTGVLANPGGKPGTGCGYSYGDVGWETPRRECAVDVVFEVVGAVVPREADVRIAELGDLHDNEPASPYRVQSADGRERWRYTGVDGTRVQCGQRADERPEWTLGFRTWGLQIGDSGNPRHE